MRPSQYFSEVWRLARESTWDEMTGKPVSYFVKVGGAFAVLGLTLTFAKGLLIEAITTLGLTIGSWFLVYGVMLLWNAFVVIPRALWRQEYEKVRNAERALTEHLLLNPSTDEPPGRTPETLGTLLNTVNRIQKFIHENAHTRVSTEPLTEDISLILRSENAVWSKLAMIRARSDLAGQVGYISRRLHTLNEPIWRSDMEYSEFFLRLNDAYKRLEAGLMNEPIPEPFNPHD